jgi:3',5'-cyclic AMP phosphodiesterase CpdA
MSSKSSEYSRRDALKCLAAGSAGTLYLMSGGVLTPVSLAHAASNYANRDAGKALFVQISDTHIGFKGAANLDVAGTAGRTVQLVNTLPRAPGLVIHTGDITHLSKAVEFDTAQQLLSGMRVTELHTIPGEHDVIDTGKEYFDRFGAASNNRGYYSFDHDGVHFIALVNVMNFKPNGLGALGGEQLAWLENDLKDRTSSTPIVVFAHMPLWSVYDAWGWGTGDADQAMSYLRRFGSVAVLNGHIHQIITKVEGNITFHTARSAAYPQPSPGNGSGPGPLTVPVEQLPTFLGLTSVTVERNSPALSVTDVPLA